MIAQKREHASERERERELRPNEVERLVIISE
jgi:hypothetical protein